MDDMYLWNLLKEHLGHDVELVYYGNKDNPANISIECNDCGCVIIDAELYTLRAREDVE